MSVSRRVVVFGAFGSALLAACGEPEEMTASAEPIRFTAGPASTRQISVTKVSSKSGPGWSPYSIAGIAGTVVVALTGEGQDEKIQAIDTRTGKEWSRPLRNLDGLGPDAHGVDWFRDISTGRSHPYVLLRVVTKRRGDNWARGCDLAALHAETGKVAWQRTILPLAQQAPGEVFPFGGNDDGVLVSVEPSGLDGRYTVCLDPERGTELWRVPNVRPLAVTDGHVLLTSALPATRSKASELAIHETRRGTKVEVSGFPRGDVTVGVPEPASHGEVLALIVGNPASAMTMIVDLGIRKVVRDLTAAAAFGTDARGRSMAVLAPLSLETLAGDEQLPVTPDRLPKGRYLNPAQVIDGVIWCNQPGLGTPKVVGVDRSGLPLTPEIPGTIIAMNAKALVVRDNETTSLTFTMYRLD